MASGKKVQELLGQMQKNLECSICLEMLRNPVSTSCGHQFCRYCLLEFLERKKQVPCPLCKKPVTKRSLTERSHLGNIVDGVHKLISAFQTDTGAVFSPLRGSHHNVLSSTPESKPAKLSGGKVGSVRKICPTRRGAQRLQNDYTDSTTTESCTISDSPRTTQSSEVPKEVELSSNEHTTDTRNINSNIRAARSGSKTSEEINKVGKACKSKGKSSSRDTETNRDESDADTLLQIIGKGDLCARQDKKTKKCLRVIEKKTKGSKMQNDSISESETKEVTEHKNNSKRKGTRKVGESLCESGDSKGKSIKRTLRENNAILGASSHSKVTSLVETFEDSVHSVEDSASETILYGKTGSPIAGKRDRLKHTDSVASSQALIHEGLTNESVSSIATGDVIEDIADDNTDSAPLFRTPTVVKKLAKEESESKDTLVNRSLRSQSKQSDPASKNVCENEIDDMGSVNLTPDVEGDKIVDFGGSKKEIHHTYSRRGRTASKDGQANKKVAAWLETIMPTNDEFVDSKPSVIEHGKQAAEKGKSSARLRNLKKQEESMGMKIKHLAEHVHKENKDMFGFEQFETDMVEKEVEKKVEGMKDVNIAAQSMETCDDKDVQVVKKRRIFKSKSNSTVSKPTTAKEGNGPSDYTGISASDCDNQILPGTKPLPTSHRLLKLESMNTDTGEHSDPYEFKSSQRTPKKVKKKGKGKGKGQKNQKKKENIYSVANKLKPAELKGCLKVQRKTTDQEIPESVLKRAGNIKVITDPVNQTTKAGKSNPLLVDSTQREITTAASNIEQAEDYDLLTCTQDAVATMPTEQRHDTDASTEHGVKEINQKRVTFREPIISDFIHSSGKIDIIGYRKAKEQKDNVTTDGNSLNVQNVVAVGSETKNLPQDPRRDRRRDTVRNTEMDTNNESESDDDHSEDWRFHDNSSGTDDLEIDPEQEEFEQPNLDIQPDEVKALLSQELEATEQTKHAEDSSNITVVEETPLVFKVPNFAANDKKHAKLSRNKLNKPSARYKTSENVTEDSPKVTLINETPLLFKVPNFGQKDVGSTKLSKSKQNELNACKDALDDVMVIKETPLLFSVPKFSEKCDTNVAIHKDVDDVLPHKDVEIEERSAELVAVPLFTAREDRSGTWSGAKEDNDSMTSESNSVKDGADGSILQNGVDLRKQTQLDDSDNVVEETPVVHVHVDSPDASADAEEYMAEDVNSSSKKMDISSNCIEGNSKKTLTDSDLTQSPDTQRHIPFVESQRKLMETEQIASDCLVSPAIETSNSIVDSISQNSESILLPRTVGGESLHDSTKESIPNSTNSSNATCSAMSMKMTKGKRKKRRCFMLEDTPESLDFGSLAEQLPANDSETTPKRRRFNRLKGGSVSPGQSRSPNNLSGSGSCSGRDISESNAIEKETKNEKYIGDIKKGSDVSRDSDKKLPDISLKQDHKGEMNKHDSESAVISSDHGLKSPRKQHISQQSVTSLKLLEESEMEQDNVTDHPSVDSEDLITKDTAMDREEIYGSFSIRKGVTDDSQDVTCMESQTNDSSVGFACKSVDQFQPDNGMSSTSSSELSQNLSTKLTGQQKVADSSGAKNTSAIFISPEDNLCRSNSFGSPEDIFQLEGHMPTVDCSPLNDTLEKVELCQVQPENCKTDVTLITDSDDSKSGDDEQRRKIQASDAKITETLVNFDTVSDTNFGTAKYTRDKVINKSHRERSALSGSGNSLTKRSDVSNEVEEPVRRDIQFAQHAEMSPDVNKRTAVRAARGFSKRNRLSNELSSPVTPVRKSNSPSPRTPNSLNFHKYKSPVAKFVSPRAKTNDMENIAQENSEVKITSKKLTSQCQTSPYSKYSSPFQKKHTPKGSPSPQVIPSPEIVDLEESGGSDDHSSSSSNSQHSLPDLQIGKDEEPRNSVSKEILEKKIKPKLSPKLMLKSPDIRKLVCTDRNRESGDAVACVVEKNDSVEYSSGNFNTSRSVVPDSMPDFHNVEKDSEHFENNNTNVTTKCSISEVEQLDSSNSSSDLPLNLSSDEDSNYIDEDGNGAKSSHNESEVSVIEESMRNTCTQNSEVSNIKNAKLNKISFDYEKKSTPSKTADKSTGHTDDDDALQAVIMESDIEESDEEDHKDCDSAEDMVIRKKPRRSILSDSSSEDEDDSSRHMNMTSSSAFSSQSENLTTQDRVALEKDLDRMAKEMAAMKEQLKRNEKSGAKFTDTMTDPKPTVIVDDDSDAIEVDNSDVEADRGLALSPPPFSPPLSPGMENASQPTLSPGMEETLPQQSLDESQVTESVVGVTTENREKIAPVEVPASLSPVDMPSRPPLADLDVNRSPARSPSPPRTRMAFAATGLTADQLQETKRLAVQNDVKFYGKFSDAVTHVIVKPAEDDETLCDRTLKLFQGIARGCWIVSHFWISDSLQVGRLLPEGPYEIQGDTANGEWHGGPRRSRLSKKKLLSNGEFALIGNNSFLSRDAITDLIQACGGVIVNDLSKVGHGQRAGFVVNCSDLDEDDREAHRDAVATGKEVYKKYGIVTLAREWLLDSVTLYKIQAVEDYIITEGSHLNIPDLV